MPNIHHSVTLCKECDQYVAVYDVFPCAECGKPVCPDCAHPTKDPNVNTCSFYCAHKANVRMKEEAA